MSEQPVLSDVAGGIATITLNRPEVMNAFSDQMREALFAVLEGYAGDAGVRVIVIAGTGRAFSAGGDIASMATLQDDNDTAVLENRMMMGGQVVQYLRAMPQPVIAAINGPAAGGGMNLALACDFRLGSENALFSEAFVKIGLVPDWGGFTFLTRLVGTAKAMELMMTGERVPAEEAYRLGLLNQLYPADTFEAEVRAFAERLAAGPPETLAGIKQGVYLGEDASLADTLAFEFRTQRRLFLAADAREGMRAFLEKRPPEFGGKREG